MTVDLENPFAGQGSVLLDIGGDVGALVVTMPPSTLGSEVEIGPVGAGHHGHHHADGHDHDHGHDHGHGHRPHVAVVNRPVADGLVPTLVFGELTAGDYELFEKGSDEVRLTVTVHGGQVTEADWES